MLTSLFYAGSFAVESLILTGLTALALGILIAIIYQITGASSDRFALILALLPFLVASVILVVNGNIGASVSVAGAFSLIRFRSAPGSAKEIGFVFLAMTAGIAVGMGFLTLAAGITLIPCIAFLLLWRTGFGQNLRPEKELRIAIPEDLSYNGVFDDLLRLYTSRSTLRRVRTTNMGTMYELSYLVQMRDPENEKEFIDALRCRNGNLTISLGLVERAKNEL